MAVKIADTIKALSNTFPVAECVDIDVNINGTTKRLQKAIDDGEIGGGESKWKGTKEDWEKLSPTEKEKYEVVYFTNDYDESGIGGSDSIWKGTRDEWEALSPTDKEKYEIVCFTNDYDSSGIDKSDSIWKGTRDEWEALLTEEKQKYVIVYFTDDYNGSGDGTGLIDDTNTSVKTTYSSSKIENSLSKKANTTDLTVHTSDTNIHVTTSDKTKWNKVDNKIDKTDIIDNLTSTNTDKPLSANQGKVLKDDIGLKANTTDLTTHTGDTNIHITTAERNKWNKIIDKVDKTDITTTIDSSSTDTQVPSTKIVKTELDKKVDKSSIVTTTINSSSTDSQVPSAKSIYYNCIEGIEINQTTIDTYGTEILKYPLGIWRIVLGSIASNFTDLPVKSAGRIEITSVNPNTIVNPWENQWSYRVYNFETINSGNYMRKLESSNEIGVISRDTGWKRVCTTSVNDVEPTIITFTDTTNYKKSTIVEFKYTVSNGICYVTGGFNCVSPTSNNVEVSTLPKPKLGSLCYKAFTFSSNDTNAAFIIIGAGGKLNLSKGVANAEYRCSFTYLVAE